MKNNFLKNVTKKSGLKSSKGLKRKEWVKKVSTPKRHYWENISKGLIANVEKIGSYWTFTKGGMKDRQETITLPKEEAMSRAKDYVT